MSEYYFYDTDYTGFAEYDITGNAYKTFLDICFRYAHSVSFYVSPNYRKDLSEILPYQLPISENIKKLYPNYTEADSRDLWPKSYTIMHFTLTPQVKDFLCRQTDHLWGWTYWLGNEENPDDIYFFRKDESVFFSSTIHEGECTLHPRENEDVSAIINNGVWYYKAEDGSLIPHTPQA